MPMSWLATGIGLVLFLINLIAAGLSWNGSWYWHSARIDSIHIHWETGAIVMEGGLIHAPKGNDGFDVGNFAFLNSGAPYHTELHETGHALNVAAFGSIFHLIPGVIEQQTSSNDSSYSEHLAESHATPGTQWPMWG